MENKRRENVQLDALHKNVGRGKRGGMRNTNLPAFRCGE